MNTTVSEIRWRQPVFGPDFDQHTFKVEDRVRIARLADESTTKNIIGHRGIVTEIDDMSPSLIEMRCATCGGVHMMHEQELDFLGDDLIRLLQDKAHIPDDPVVVNESNENLEDFLAVGMHRAGFLRISVQDRAAPAGDPRYPRPVWTKHVFGFIGRLAPFRVYHDALIKIAEQAGGYLVEWASFSHKSGYDSLIMDDDLDTLTLEMPIRALMVAKATTEMSEYDEIKEMVTYWLQDKHQIDIGAIYRAVKEQGFGMGNWSRTEANLVTATGPYYKMTLVWKKHDGEGFEAFRAWATRAWEWEGSFDVYIDDAGNRRDNGFSPISEFHVSKKPGEPPKVEEAEDVPF